MKAQDCMHENVCCCKTSSSVEDVAKLMQTTHVGCIPVCDDCNNIVGIVTDRDIVLRSVACNKDAKQTPITDIMTCNICSCEKNDDMTDVENKMSQNQVRRIPVVDNGKVVGILTMGDLANYGQDLGEDQVCRTINCICGCQDKNAE